MPQRKLLAASVQAILPSGVAFLDPDRDIYNAMIEGWRRQQRSRSLNDTTIVQRVRTIEHFHHFTSSYPWQWTAADFIDYSSGLATELKNAISTRRQKQNNIRLFMEYASDPRYGWLDTCEKHFGSVPEQICDEWNLAAHVDEYEGRPGRRPLSFDEVQTLFDYVDNRFDIIRNAGKKGSLAAARDAVMLKLVYAYGLRRREPCRIVLPDFHNNSAVPDYGRFGALHVRHGKSSRGSTPKRRTVLTVPEFDWIVDSIQQYIEVIRPQFGAGEHPGLFVTERAGYVTPGDFGDRFRQMVKESGLPEELELHCLRHSYSTHLAEFGYDPFFIQQQLGHAHQSTTSIYTHVSNDFKNRQIKHALRRLYDRET